MKLRRTRYQQGSLQRIRRADGSEVWEFRWRERQTDGRTVRRNRRLGTLKQYPSRAAALQRAATLRSRTDPSVLVAETASLESLIEHYRGKELHENCERKSFSTKNTYERYLRKWIVPRGGSYRLGDIKTVAVEEWLQQIPRSDGTKAKIRNIISALFRHAMRHEWYDRNPISLVRQSAKRRRAPDVLEVQEIRALIGVLEPRERTLVLLDLGTGLRMGELMGLKWADVDFERRQINITRSIVKQVVGPCKTEASQKPMPLDPHIAQELLTWRQSTPYRHVDDWIFASMEADGKFPYWAATLMREYIRPAAEKSGITKHISWHTFRHTFSTLLKANGEDVKVVQELLRHASSKITLDTYAQAVTPAKRRAQSKLVRMILPRQKRRLARVSRA
jgi:integrase